MIHAVSQRIRNLKCYFIGRLKKNGTGIFSNEKEFVYHSVRKIKKINIVIPLFEYCG